MRELPEYDLDTPNIGRIHDYFLGGAANTAADRAAGEQMLRGWPQGAAWSQLARACLRRMVTTLVDEHGLDQFLDLGSGIPTVGTVHEVAHRSRPDARVAYVDFDPVTVHYALSAYSPLEGVSRVLVTSHVRQIPGVGARVPPMNVASNRCGSVKCR